jgi:hypothetical protein
MTAPVQTRTDHPADSQVATSVQPPAAGQAVPPSLSFLNIKRSYLEALQALGYTESEARFLYVVATHSGYFVARQFLAFTCGHWGKRATAFWHKLHTKKHARTEYSPMHGKVYHVFSRKLYGQIGRENLRKRISQIKKQRGSLGTKADSPKAWHSRQECRTTRFSAWPGRAGTERTHNRVADPDAARRCANDIEGNRNVIPWSASRSGQLEQATSPNVLIRKMLVGAVGIEHDPRTTKSRGMMALQPPAKSNC